MPSNRDKYKLSKPTESTGELVKSTKIALLGNFWCGQRHDKKQLLKSPEFRDVFPTRAPH